MAAEKILKKLNVNTEIVPLSTVVPETLAGEKVKIASIGEKDIYAPAGDENAVEAVKVNGTALPIASDKSVELANVDGGLVAKSLLGAANGVATLGDDGRVPSGQLPSYVSDIVEVDTYESLPATGKSNTIYITKDTNKVYRWSGSQYVEVSPSEIDAGAVHYTKDDDRTFEEKKVARANVGLSLDISDPECTLLTVEGIRCYLYRVLKAMDVAPVGHVDVDVETSTVSDLATQSGADTETGKFTDVASFHGVTVSDSGTPATLISSLS